MAGVLWVGLIAAAVQVAAAVAVVRVGRIHQVRATRVDLAAEALQGRLGLTQPLRRSVKCTRWDGVIPQQIELHHAVGVGQNLEPDNRPGGAAWNGSVQTELHRIFEATYAVTSRSSRTITFSTSEAVSVPEDEQWIDTQLRALIPSAGVDQVERDDDGAVKAITAHHGDPIKIANVGYRRRVNSTFNTVMGGEWRFQWNLTGTTFTARKRNIFPSMVRLPVDAVTAQTERNLALWAANRYDEVSFLTGLDEDGQEHPWFPAISPHMLVAGYTGSGKTSALQSLTMQWTACGWPVWIGDGKGIEFLGMQDWPHVQVVSSKAEDHVSVLTRANQLVQDRYDKVIAGVTSEAELTPVLVLVDELTVLAGLVSDWYLKIKALTKGKLPTKTPALSDFANSLRLARTARVHYVIGMQRADQAFFNEGDMRENIPARWALGRTTPQSSTMMWGLPHIGVTLNKRTRGRGFVMNAEGEPVEVQAYYVPDPRKAAPDSADAAYLQQIRPPEPPDQRLLIMDPDEELLETNAYQAWALRPWDYASRHPDRDPVVQRAAAKRLGPEATSTLALLGLTNPSVPTETSASPDTAAAADTTLPQAANTSDLPAPSAPDLPGTTDAEPATAGLHLIHDTGLGDDDTAVDIDDDQDDEWAGFGAIETTNARRLQCGDLIRNETGQWAVIDDDPEPDPDDPDYVLVPWTCADQSGALSVSRTEILQVRRPE